MSSPIPSLSAQGLVSDPLQKLDKLLAYMFVSEANQSYLYNGKVVSVAAIRQQNENNPAAFATALQTAVNDYIKQHFDQVAVKTTIEDPLGNGQYNMLLTVIVVDNSRDYTSAWRYSPSDSKFVRVAKAVNEGV